MKSQKLLMLVIIFMVSCATPNIPTPTPTLTQTPIPTATNTLTPTPTITPSPTPGGGGTGELIFVYRNEEFIDYFPELDGEIHVFKASLVESVVRHVTNITPITNGLENYNYLLDVSPDGTKVLIVSTSEYAFNNHDSRLYVVDLRLQNTEPIKLADGVPNNNGLSFPAKWLDDSRIVYVGQGESGFGIYKVNADGSSSEIIYKYNNDGVGNKPYEILATDDTRIYWVNRIDTVRGGNRHYTNYYVWWSSFDGSERAPLEFNGKQLFFTHKVFGDDLVISPSGTKIAWIEKATRADPQNYLNVASISDIENPKTVNIMSSRIRINWFPDESKILVFDKRSVDMSKETIIDRYKQASEEIPESFFDTYGVYEIPIAPNLPVKNYNLDDDFMGVSISDVFNRELYDLSPDGRQTILPKFHV